MGEFIVVILIMMTFFGVSRINPKETEQQKIIKLLCDASPECKKELNNDN